MTPEELRAGKIDVLVVLATANRPARVIWSATRQRDES